jgi:tetratricopeptide (TPR) repeat protein
MGCFRVSAQQSGFLGTRGLRFVLAVVGLFAFVMAPEQAQAQFEKASQDATASATLLGSVRDSSGHPVADVTVYLQVNIGAEPLITRTDSSGIYRFLALREGVYSLRAEKEEYGKATLGPWVLGQKQAKRIDLTLPSLNPSAQESSGSPTQGKDAGQTGKPEFFDEPEFIVAGVTDSTNLGGHGSNTVARNKEALAKETVSLSRDVPARPQLASSPPAVAREKSWRALVEREPGNFTANRQLGKMLVADGKAGEALPYLERASRLNSGDYESAYELARAYADANKYENARTAAQALLTAPDKSAQHKAQLHHLLADVEEQQGKSLEAVREYQRAAELDPNEVHLFDWGAELLMHRAAEPAIEVFHKGNHQFPRSARMLVGLGVAFYAGGSYDQAAQRLCEAADLNPDDPNPYLFIGKMQSAGAAQSDCMAARLERFARRQPENALANYYYALSLSKQRKSPDEAQTFTQVDSLLQKAVRLDPKLGVGYLQLGILYSDQHDFPRAIAAYQKAITASPWLEEAHYRLAQLYRRTGEQSKAQLELQQYEQLSKKTEEETERQRHEIQQFVYTLRKPTSAAPPPE